MAYVGNAAANKVLLSTTSGPVYSQASYPSTTTANQILYSSATNVIDDITTANNSILSTNSSGVPSLGTSLNNDYTFTSSTATDTRTLTVSNTDNTSSSSNALILTKTGGASSGDAVYQSSTTTTTWTWGIDNSVTSPTADPFVIAQGTTLGTNNIMSVATTGEINFPLQSAFLAALTSDATDVTGDGTTYTLAAATEIFDQNNDYSSPTFTAPISGRYSFSVSMDFQLIAAGHSSGTAEFVASNRTVRYWQNNPGTMGATQSACGTMLIDMDAADTVTTNLQIGGSTKVIDVIGAIVPAYFSGHLVC